jgi:outer membrane protein
MRLTSRLVVSAAFLSFASLFTATASAQKKIAHVDVQRAAALTEEGLRAAATLRKMSEGPQREMSQHQAELQKQKEEIEKQAQAHSLPQQALQSKYEELQRKAAEFQQKYVEVQKDLDRQQRLLMEPVFDKIGAAIKHIAETDGYDMILDRPALAYSRADLDLMDRVIQFANDAAGKPSPPPATSAPASSAGPAKAPPAPKPASKP